LLGGNGTGKTTLLEILVGLTEPDTGSITRPKGSRIGYLPQELLEEWTGSVIEEVLRGADHILSLTDKLRKLEVEISTTSGQPHDDALERYGATQSQFEQQGGYHVEAEARRILGGLGFTAADMDRPLKEMSGGWQMRAALARLLLEEPDVLVLDEPTNHLDVDSVLWLEEQLRAWPHSLLFVSHDRDFIDAVADKVIEVAWNTTTEYTGGFAEFVVQREERIAMAEARAANQARQRAHAEKFIERFRYKATKARQVQSRIKTLQRLEEIQVPQIEELKLAFGFPEPRRSSRVVIDINSSDMGYPDGDVVVYDVNLVVERGEKLALIGPNGAGKTTVLKTILGEIAPKSGSVSIGSNVDVSYFAQHQVDALDLALTVEQEFRKAVGAQPKNRNVRTVLGSFGFRGDAVDRRVLDLSGGERTRLALAETMCNPVNLLILDEPTNHLDLPSCDTLEDALSVYPGTVLIVSHDRHLIRNTVTSLVEVRDGGLTRHSDVEEHVLNRPADRPAKSSGSAKLSKKAAAKANSPSPVRPGSAAETKARKRAEAQARQASRQAEKDVERLERKVVNAEAVVADFERQLADPVIYEDKAAMQALIGSHEKAKKLAEKLVASWEAAVANL
jgi:ATP-binding cassette subfamily F protein 3